MLGRQLSRYRILEQIGSGGMSVVYRGMDTSLEREVAIKVLHPHLASKEDSRRRFSREAKAVAKLHHPNILEIFDFSCDDSADSFIVTEYIRGTTLRTFGEKVHLDSPPEIAAMAGCELASALRHAHDLGIIHRDLKPENVMIRDDGVLKLMDFGIAKVLDRDERMTMTGALVGSPAHMAPEIIEGLEAGREADIFSLGTILYWLCCGVLPFQGNNTTQTLKLILEAQFTDPRTVNPCVSDELAAIIARCLAREPQDRYEDAAALHVALEDLLLAAGIERPGEEFATFYVDPEPYKSRLRKRLTEQLLGEAERCTARESRNHPRALDCLNRVLALDPSNEQAVLLLDKMKRRSRRQRALIVAGAAAAGIALLVGGGVWIASRPERPAPSSEATAGATPGASAAGATPGASAAGAAPSAPAAGAASGANTASGSPAPSGGAAAGASDPSGPPATSTGAASGSSTGANAGAADPSGPPATSTGAASGSSTGATAGAGSAGTATDAPSSARAGLGPNTGAASPPAGNPGGSISGAQPVSSGGTGRDASASAANRTGGSAPRSSTAPGASKASGGASGTSNKPIQLARAGTAGAAAKPSSAVTAAKATQNLEIRVRPFHYARIFLDGQHVNPTKVHFVGPVAVGTHRLRIESEHVQPFEQDILVPAEGEGPKLSPTLVPLPALLKVVVRPSDALLLVNGTPRGRAGESEKDPIPVKLPEGQIKGPVPILLSRAGFGDHEQVVECVAGRVTTLQVEMRKP